MIASRRLYQSWTSEFDLESYEVAFRENYIDRMVLLKQGGMIERGG